MDKYVNVGQEQMKAILIEVINTLDNTKDFSFVNGILDCEKILGEFQIWLHWGDIRIVPSEIRYKDGLTAGELEILEDWNTEADGTITLIGKKD